MDPTQSYAYRARCRRARCRLQEASQRGKTKQLGESRWLAFLETLGSQDYEAVMRKTWESEAWPGTNRAPQGVNE